jgi:thiol-disulfide isomerase/thioredoxin
VGAGVWVVVVAVVVAVGFGLFRLVTDGRFRGSVADAPVGAPPEATPWDDVLQSVPEARLGERATLLQFSSAFCAPCRATRRTLSDVAAIVPGVVHLEVDAEQHLELVRRLGVLRTPTTLVLDANGREVTRASGAPRKEQVVAALASA